MDISAAVQGVVDQLVAAGIRATRDPRDVNTPCVLVWAPTIHFRFGKPTYTADFEAWALVGDSGTRAALDAASSLITATQDALMGAIVTATPDDFALADGGTASGYRLTWTQRIPA